MIQFMKNNQNISGLVSTSYADHLFWYLLFSHGLMLSAFSFYNNSCTFGFMCQLSLQFYLPFVKFVVYDLWLSCLLLSFG